MSTNNTNTNGKGERYTFNPETRTLLIREIACKKPTGTAECPAWPGSVTLDLEIDLSEAPLEWLAKKAGSALVIDFQSALRGKSWEFARSLNGKTYKTTPQALTALEDPHEQVRKMKALLSNLTPEQRAELLKQLAGK